MDVWQTGVRTISSPKRYKVDPYTGEKADEVNDKKADEVKGEEIGERVGKEVGEADKERGEV